MKIEIDLNDIMSDPDYGAETLNESIRRQVVDNVTRTIKDGIGKRIDSEVARIIDEQIVIGLKDKLPALVEDVLTVEYVPVDRYGSKKGEATTLRAEIVKTVTEQMVYAPKDRYSHSDKNAFTSAVDGLISKHVDQFKSAFNKTIDQKFVQEAMDYATQKLAERLKVSLD